MEGVRRLSEKEVITLNLRHFGGAVLEVVKGDGTTEITTVPTVSLQDYTGDAMLDTEPAHENY